MWAISIKQLSIKLSTEPAEIELKKVVAKMVSKVGDIIVISIAGVSLTAAIDILGIR